MVYHCILSVMKIGKVQKYNEVLLITQNEKLAKQFLEIEVSNHDYQLTNCEKLAEHVILECDNTFGLNDELDSYNLIFPLELALVYEPDLLLSLIYIDNSLVWFIKPIDGFSIEDRELIYSRVVDHTDFEESIQRVKTALSGYENLGLTAEEYKHILLSQGIDKDDLGILNLRN